MDTAIELIFFVIIVIAWIGGAIVKKLKQEGAEKDTEPTGKRVYNASSDEVKAFLREMGVAPESRQQPAPKPKPAPQPQTMRPAPRPSPSKTAAPAAAAVSAALPRQPSHTGMTAADALRAAAARRATRKTAAPKPLPEPAPASQAAATPKPAPGRPMKRMLTMQEEAAARKARASEDILTNLSGLPVMQKAVVLREILGPSPGLGSDPLRREV